MPNKWLIAVDLDGTLFQTDHQVSSRTLKTMHSVVELGHSMVVVTGRSSHTAIPRLQSIPDGIRVICSNGAYEYDRTCRSIVRAHYLPSSLSSKIRQLILKELKTASFGWESAEGLCYEPKFITEAGGAHTLEQGGHKDTLGQCDLLKVYVRTPEQKGGELAATLHKILDGEVEVSSSGAPFAEITAAGVNKGSALAKVATELGFTSDHTMAFGDNLNDTSMLRWAGVSVAMGNAIPEVKAMANRCTLSNGEDGVADYLEKVILKNLSE